MNARLRMALMLAGLLFAGWLAVFGDKTPVDAPVAARIPERAAKGSVQTRAPTMTDEGEQEEGQVRRLLPRTGWFALASKGTDIFSATAMSGEAQAQVAAPAPPPESPFRLIGRLEEAGRWSYFVERDDAVHVLHPGGVADGFRLDSATDHELKLTRLSDKVRFVIAIDSDKH